MSIISNSTITNCRAKHTGGAICIHSCNVSIFDSTLTNNRVVKSGGSIDVFESSTLILNNTNITRSKSVVILNIKQSNVRFTGKNIISNNNGPVYAFDSRVEFNGPTRFSNNHGGLFGGAIKAVQSDMVINTEGVIITNNTATSGGGIFLQESTLFVNEPVKITHNTAKDGGGIYAYSSRIVFKSALLCDGRSRSINKQSDIFQNNAENGGGIHAVATTIKLTQSYVNIDSNTATAKGGGVYLEQSSKLYLFKNSKQRNCFV